MIQSAIANPETNIAEAELGGAGAAQILTGTQKEIEADDEALGRRCGMGRDVMRVLPHLRHQGQGQGLHSGRGIIGPLPRAVQGGQAIIDEPVGVQTRVRGPHAGVRLAHRSYGVLHGTSPNRSTAGGNGAVAVALGIELQKSDGIPGAQLSGVDA